MIAIQQRAPRRMDFPLDLIIAMRLVLRPIALIANDDEEYGELFER